jgi:hypothetical protein
VVKEEKLEGANKMTGRSSTITSREIQTAIRPLFPDGQARSQFIIQGRHQIDLKNRNPS